MHAGEIILFAFMFAAALDKRTKLEAGCLFTRLLRKSRRHSGSLGQDVDRAKVNRLEINFEGSSEKIHW